MKSESHKQDTSNDVSLINSLIRSQTRTDWIICGVSVVVLIVAWIIIAGLILNFGKSINWNSFEQIPAQVREFIQGMNIYIWWAIILIISLIVYFIVVNIIEKTHKSSGHKYPANEDLLPVIRSLSPAGLRVLNWVWDKRREPISIKDLRETSRQLKRARNNRITQIQEQESLLAAHDRLSTSRGPVAQTYRETAADADPVIQPRQDNR